MKDKSPLITIFLVLFSLGLKSFSHDFLEFSLFEDDYLNKNSINTIVNVLLSFCYLIFIYANNIKNNIGLGVHVKFKIHPIYLPLLYAVLINLLSFEFEGKLQLNYLFVLLTHMLSVGMVEELSFRGIIQNTFIEFFGKERKGIIKSIVLSALLFSLIHLINFNKGLWGEMAQFSYALFIGLSFGVVLFITKRIYPLIIIHGLIDFASGIDRMGISSYTIEPSTPENSILVILLLSPYLFYAIYLFKKIKTST